MIVLILDLVVIAMASIYSWFTDDPTEKWLFALIAALFIAGIIAQ